MATTDERLSSLEQQVSNTMTKVDMLIQEMRDRDNQRAAEIREIRQRQDAAQAKHDAEMREIRQRQDEAQAKHDAEMKAAQAKHDAEMHEMNERFYSKIDDLGKQMHSNFIQTMVGFGAIAAAVGSIVIAAFR